MCIMFKCADFTSISDFKHSKLNYILLTMLLCDHITITTFMSHTTWM